MTTDKNLQNKSSEEKRPGRTPESVNQYREPETVRKYFAHSGKGAVAWTEIRFVQHVLERFGHLCHLRVVDVGTGPGWIPIALAKAKPTWSIVGLDSSSLMLKIARAQAEKQAVRVEWTLGAAESLPFANDTIDLVISHLAFHEFPDPLGVGREISRVLKDGGSLVLQDLRRPPRWQIPALHLLGVLLNFSIDMGRQYRDSLQASYRKNQIFQAPLGPGSATLVGLFVDWQSNTRRLRI
jgi:SAM-dependent methyltransferase